MKWKKKRQKKIASEKAAAKKRANFVLALKILLLLSTEFHIHVNMHVYYKL